MSSLHTACQKFSFLVWLSSACGARRRVVSSLPVPYSYAPPLAHSTNLEESINFGIRGSFGRKIGSSTGLDSGPRSSPTPWVPVSFSWNLPELPAPQVWLGRSEAAAALQAFSNFDLMKPNKGDFPALGSPVGVAHQHGLQRKVGFGHA